MFIPHLITVPLCMGFALVVKFLWGFGSIDAWWQGMLDGKSSMPAARIGPPFLFIVFVVAFTAVASVLLTFSLAGISALINGAAFGVVLGSFIDFFLLKGTIPPDSLNIVRKWASYAAVVSVVLILWVSVVNPLLSQLGKHPTDGPGFAKAVGIFTWTGCIFVLVGGFAGFARFLFAKFW